MDFILSPGTKYSGSVWVAKTFMWRLSISFRVSLAFSVFHFSYCVNSTPS